MLLHVDHEQTAIGVGGHVLPEGSAVSEEDVASAIGEQQGVWAEEGLSLILVDELGLLGVVGEGDDRLPEEVGEVVAALGLVVGHCAYLSVYLGEQFELSLQVLDDFAVEGAEDQRLLRLEGRVDCAIHLQDLL